MSRNVIKLLASQREARWDAVIFYKFGGCFLCT
jgi:hypothetical protein